MPNAISGVSSVALSRAVFRILPGEYYNFHSEQCEEIDLDKFIVVDGTEELIILYSRVYNASVVEAHWSGGLMLYRPPDYNLNTHIDMNEMGGAPAYVEAGGLDRLNSIIFSPFRAPYVGKLRLEVANCETAVYVLLHSGRYKNRARDDLGATVLLGEWKQAGYLLGKAQSAEYSDNTVGEVDVSKLDLGAVLNVKKFATRVAYVSYGAVAGSSVRCYVSEDNVEWTKIWEKVDLPGEQTEEYIQVNDITARYIKFTLDANSVPESATLWQFPLFAWVE